MAIEAFTPVALLARALRKLRRHRTRSAEMPTSDAAGEWTDLDPLQALGSVVVFAPHPDDESLACGGLIARLCQENCRVRVVIMSDGSASHPGSRRFPSARLAALRQDEARAAGSRLGLDPHGCMDFIGLRDSAVPDGPEVPGFDQAVAVVADALQRSHVETVVVPLRSDAHADHRACYNIVMAAVATLGHSLRVLEYGVWAGGGGVGPPPDLDLQLFRRYRLTVASVLRRKKAAIRCHRSQLTDLIKDDPTGFRLSPRMVAHFLGQWEVYYEGLPTQVGPDESGTAPRASARTMFGAVL